MGLSGKSPTIVNIMRMVCKTSMWPGSQGEWTGMHICQQWRLHWTSQMSLSEHVYCVAVAFKLTEWSNESASNFVLSLNIPLCKLFGWFRKPQLWATGDWQLHHNNTPTHVSSLIQIFLGGDIKSPRWLSPSTAQIWCPATSGFSQN